MKIMCDKPGCKLTGNHDHLEVVVRSGGEGASSSSGSTNEASAPRDGDRPEHPACNRKDASDGRTPGASSAEAEPRSLMSLLGDALDECAGVSESFTGKPSSLRETAKKVRKVNSAGEKLGKLGQAVQDSKLPALGRKIVQTVKDNARMREYK